MEGDIMEENVGWLMENTTEYSDPWKVNQGSFANSISGLYDGEMNSTKDSYDPNIIFYEHPEDMLNPTKRNPIFYHIIITHAVTFVVGILGNLVAVFVMIGDRKSRNATNLFLVSLAVADLLLLLLCVPLEVLQYFLQFDDNGFICKMAKYVLLLSASASVLNLCAVSLERFIVIVFPMRSRSLCTLSNCRKAILFVWVVATILALPVILTKEGYMVTYTNNVTSVKVYYCEEANVDLPFAIYQFVILFAAPGLLMMICYIYVIRELWRSTRNINLLTNSRSFHGDDHRGTNANSNNSSGRSKMSRFMSREKRVPKSDVEKSVKYAKSETGASHTSTRRSVNHVRANRGEDVKKARKQVIKMLILVIVLFLICWGPKLILAIALKLATIFGVEVYTPALYNARVIFSLIPFIHSCFNPFIYMTGRNFRRSMSRQLARVGAILGCNCIKNSSNRNTIPLRSAIRTRKPHGPESTFSSNYYSISDGTSTRHTEVHGISTI